MLFISIVNIKDNENDSIATVYCTVYHKLLILLNCNIHKILSSLKCINNVLQITTLCFIFMGTKIYSAFLWTRLRRIRSIYCKRHVLYTHTAQIDNLKEATSIFGFRRKTDDLLSAFNQN